MTNKDKVYEVLKSDTERVLQDGRGYTGFTDWVYEALEGSQIPKATIKRYIHDFRKEHKKITKSNSKTNKPKKTVTKSNSKAGKPKKTVTKSVTNSNLILIIEKLGDEIKQLNNRVSRLQTDKSAMPQSVLQKVRKMNDIKPHTVRISKSLLKRCKTEAKIKGLKLFEVINLALLEYLEID